MFQDKFIHYIKKKLLKQKKKIKNNKNIFDKCVVLKDTIVEKLILQENLTDVFDMSLSRSRFKHCLNFIKFVEE